MPTWPKGLDKTPYLLKKIGETLPSVQRSQTPLPAVCKARWPIFRKLGFFGNFSVFSEIFRDFRHFWGILVQFKWI